MPLSPRVKIDHLEFVEYLRAEEIQSRIEEISEEINKDYLGKYPVVFIILNGAFMFAADLLRQLKSDMQIYFLKVQSYEGMESTGKVQFSLPKNLNLKDRDILIIEDIVDTGKTMAEFTKALHSMGCSEIRIASLLTKPECMEHPIDVHYVCFEIPNKFVIGYGLDYDGKARQLRHIYQLDT
jgi:hypoxanthine phosphoribosyltransferase